MATDPQPASDFTIKANKAVKDSLPFSDESDFQDAKQGFLKTWDPVRIENANNHKVIWTLEPYANQTPNSSCPPTVNPSLWRQSTLNQTNGLFKVADGFYQVRAFDMSNMTIIEGAEGLIVIDPLISCECANDALRLYRDYVQKPNIQVKAVIYTHSHVDHFGGVCGIVDPVDVREKRVRIAAPAGFLEHAVSENVYAGTAMGRRAEYMYGPYLKPGDRGQVDAGLGKSQSVGRISIIPPTDEVSYTGQILELDGVKIIFHMTPGAEAPAEFDFYFPDKRVFCAAENATHTMHNIQTLRGARVRDALSWSKYLGEALELYGHEAEVLFAQHHWPIWGNQKIASFLAKQRDMYRYLNDQTLRMLNKGYTGIEIAEVFEMPPSIAQAWFGRGYYGTVNHNVKAVYDRYMGWFDGNPTNLYPLPPRQSSAKYVELMGGADKVIKAGVDAMGYGEYRWAAELLGKVVVADPNNKEAKEQQANALEQLGYQAEAATWRNFFLMGAQELRNGIRTVDDAEASETDDSMFEAMTLDMIFDSIAGKLIGPKATSPISMSWRFTDTGEKYLVEVSNGALSYIANKQSDDVDLVITTSRKVLDDLLLKKTTFTRALDDKTFVMSGKIYKFVQFISWLDHGDKQFPIVTPKPGLETEWKGDGMSTRISPEMSQAELLRHPAMTTPRRYFARIPKGC